LILSVQEMRKEYLMSNLSRRDFLRFLMTLSAAGLASYLSGCKTLEATLTKVPSEVAKLPTRGLSESTPPVNTATAEIPVSTEGAYLAVARGEALSPAERTRRAIASVGGIERYVKKGADVIIKPNICNAYHGPEYASTTNPEVVAAIVGLCLSAGAKRVRVMDFPFGGKAKNAYETSGIAQAVEAVGGQMELMNLLKYQKVEIPNAMALKKTEVYGDILNADTVINVPIAKHHSGAGLTLGLKNLMGVILNRGALHANGLHQSIVDLSTIVRPHLTVIDATRILVGNGPTGGSLSDVREMDTVIASQDVVAADAYAATLFNMTGADIEYIRLADQLGLGTMDLKSITIETIDA
jgi:uncharacterized protein (DUF362 family)